MDSRVAEAGKLVAANFPSLTKKSFLNARLLQKIRKNFSGDRISGIARPKASSRQPADRPAKAFRGCADPLRSRIPVPSACRVRAPKRDAVELPMGLRIEMLEAELHAPRLAIIYQLQSELNLEPERNK